MHTLIKFTGNKEIAASLLAKKPGSDWEKIESGNSFEYEIMKKDRDYEVYVIAVTNYSISDSQTYSISITAKGLLDYIDLEEKDAPTVDDLSNNCEGIEAEDLIDLSESLLDLGDAVVFDHKGSGRLFNIRSFRKEIAVG